MTTLEKIRAEIQKVLDKERDFTSENAKAQAIALNWCIKIIDRYAEQDQEITVSVLPDENGYYPNVCGMCANAESELCEWCGGNKNFKKEQTKIPDFYKKYAEQEPTIRPSFSYTAEIKADDEQLERLQGILNGEMVLRLEQEPCEDAVSRQAVFDLIEHYNSDGLGSVFIDFRHGIKFADAINELPSVQPKLAECVDAVSRQAVLEIIDKWYENNSQLLLNDCIEDLIVYVTYMPSVRPQEPKLDIE